MFGLVSVFGLNKHCVLMQGEEARGKYVGNPSYGGTRYTEAGTEFPVGRVKIFRGEERWNMLFSTYHHARKQLDIVFTIGACSKARALMLDT